MDPRYRRLWRILFLIVLAVGCGFFFWGGGAARAKKALQRGAEEITGHRAVRSGEGIKSQLDAISAERNRQIREAQGR